MQVDTIRINIPKPTAVETNGVKLQVMRAGDANGEPIVLLHGFPEFWYAWHDYIEPLAEAGYRVIIPDLRGYNLSDKPEGVASYAMRELVADVVGLLDAYDYESVRLVGHDWGGIIAWNVAIFHPERVSQLVIANVPHPLIHRAFLRNDLRQQLKGWYVGFFQLPTIPETLLRLNRYGIMSQFMRDIPGMTEREVRLYQQAWSQPGALTAMLRYYRAVTRHGLTVNSTDGRVKPPTLVFWGKRDPALIHDMVPPSLEYCDDAHAVYFEDAGHFVQHEKSSEMLEYLLAYFAEGLDGVRG
jgi:pimeloyl-ACP methyl ester carboxylesterase